jgi:NADPH:quinone reductase-like Zn-dependent oxidoreductase
MINSFGGPQVASVGEAPRPVPGAGQVLVRIAAAGVNPVDWKVREGYLKDAMPFSFPTILGCEVAGTIEALGEDVTGLSVGEAVHASTGVTGGFAEYVALDAGQLARKPANLSMAEAAAVPIAAATAVAALNAGNVGPKTRILIHAAAGGVGSVAVQLAKLRGAEVTALASPANLDFVRGLGATHAIDRTGPYESQIGNFDVVLDAFGPEAQARSWRLLRRGGILVTLVAPPSQDVAAANGVRATMVIGAPTAAVIVQVNKHILQGDLKISVARTYPLEQALAALAEVERGHVRGKVVLTVFDWSSKPAAMVGGRQQ